MILLADDLNQNNDLKARTTLLNHYTSQTTAHVGYLLALAVAFSPIIQALFYPIIFPSSNFVIFFVYVYLFSLIFSFFPTLSLYFMARLVYYGQLAHRVKHDEEITLKDKETSKSGNIMGMIEEKAGKLFDDKPKHKAKDAYFIKLFSYHGRHMSKPFFVKWIIFLSTLTFLFLAIFPIYYLL